MTRSQTSKPARKTRWREMLVIPVPLLLVVPVMFTQPTTAPVASNSAAAASLRNGEDRRFRAGAISSDRGKDFLGQDHDLGDPQTNVSGSDSTWIMPAIVLLVAWGRVGFDMLLTERRRSKATSD